ncbi:uncharacterized protein [Globicephala melas]|uniref:uncharacterized protein isoform X5 n=1 Tax=Globicephala melas TaxID=9731 RepID=UPI00293D82AE|nr:uncharacterized protein LOC115856942 isoform X5 [Globicephala melas]
MRNSISNKVGQLALPQTLLMTNSTSNHPPSLTSIPRYGQRGEQHLTPYHVLSAYEQPPCRVGNIFLTSQRRKSPMLRKAEWPEECSFQALQRLQQMRVRLRPPLQVAQQLRGREELPLRTNRHFEVLKNHTDVWFVFLPAAPVETQAPAILALAALLILLGLLSTALLGHLLCFHIYLMWHKLTTYEYIVQHRPPQEAKGAHRELESCPPRMRPIQEMEFYMRTFSHVRPEPPGQARPASVNANSSRFLATRGHVEPPPPSSPETLALPPRIRPQKKRKRRMYKVRTSRTLDREAPLPRLPGERPFLTGSCSGNYEGGKGTATREKPGGMAASTDVAGLEESFRKFAIHGDPKASGHELNGKNWAKLCKDCKVADGKAVTGTDVDIVFSKVKGKSARVINYEEFKKALEELAPKRFKGKSKEEAFDAICQLVAGKEPANVGVTKAKTGGAVERLTDTSKYTGSHKERFDESGKGKGIAGRQDILDDSGYVSAYKNAGTYDAKVKK